MELWEKSVDGLLDRDDDVHRQIKEMVSNHGPGTPEYEKWTTKFYELHAMRPEASPDGHWPADVNETFGELGKDVVPVIMKVHSATMWTRILLSFDLGGKYIILTDILHYYILTLTR